MRRFAFAILGMLSLAAPAMEAPYRAPRLDIGQPDLQGVWIASNSTPLQRPSRFKALRIDETEAAELFATLDARAEDRASPTEPTEYFEALSIEPIRGGLRSSLIVDPPDGLIPGNDRFKQELGAALAGVLAAMDGVEQRPAAERCIGSQTVQPPILSIRNGVNLHQIVQTKDAFVFMSEFIGATRIIRLNAAPLHAAITSWLGDSIGRWEGDALVVQTRGFTPSDRLRAAGGNNSFLVSPQTVVTERFVRSVEQVWERLSAAITHIVRFEEA